MLRFFDLPISALYINSIWYHTRTARQNRPKIKENQNTDANLSNQELR